MAKMTTSTPPPQPRRRRHHRLSFVCVNDVYSLDDLDLSPSGGSGPSSSSSAAPPSPRGGWCRAATPIKRIVSERGGGDAGVDGDAPAPAPATTPANTVLRWRVGTSSADPLSSSAPADPSPWTS